MDGPTLKASRPTILILVTLALGSCAPAEDGVVSSTRQPAPVTTETSAVEQRTTAVVTSAPSTADADPDPAAPILPGSPAEVVDREPLPFCGFVDETRGGSADPRIIDLVHDDDADDCFSTRWGDRVPAELVRAMTSVEGDVIVVVQRVTSSGEAEVYVDATEDDFGSRSWEHYRCTGFDAQGPTDCSGPRLLTGG